MQFIFINCYTAVGNILIKKVLSGLQLGIDMKPISIQVSVHTTGLRQHLSISGMLR